MLRALALVLGTALLGCSSASVYEQYDDGSQSLGPDGTGGTSAGQIGGTSGSAAGGGDATGGAATTTGGTASGTGGDGSGGGGNEGGGTSKGAAVARKLGRATNFLIGMGNDGDPWTKDYTRANLGVTLDLHYLYLVANWDEWNPGGSYVDNIINESAKNGVVGMVTVYDMAGWGDGNVWAVQDAGYMTDYWRKTELLFKRIAATDKPAVVHFEPDFWEYVRNQAGGNSSFMAKVKLNARCSDLPDTMAGMGKCMVRIAREVAPKAVIGFHASHWYGWGSAGDVSRWMRDIGAAEADVIFVETLDRDAGCFEAKGPECQRSCNGCYWSDSDFKGHFGWVKQISDNLGLPALWWQTPFGVPSSTPGGSPGHYRDNRVQYFFSHLQDMIDAGGMGAAFGTGAGNQTYITSDGGQFKNAVNGYYANPVALP